MTYGEKCYCGHAMRSHSSFFYGRRHYRGCRFCGCKLYSEKSSGKEEWVRLNKIQSELRGSEVNPE